jgi:hypothetical protein
MTNPENAVREAARELHNAIKAAAEAGLRVMWPSRAESLPSIAVSETKRTIPAGQPLDLTAKERAALPPLDPGGVDDPAKRIAVTADAKSDAASKPAEKSIG